MHTQAYNDFDFTPSGQPATLVVENFACEMCETITPQATLTVIGTDHTIHMGGRFLRLGIVTEGPACGCQSLCLFRIHTEKAEFARSQVDDRLVPFSSLSGARLVAMPPGVYDFRNNFYCGLCDRLFRDFAFECFLTDVIIFEAPMRRLAYFISPPPCGCSHSVMIGTFHEASPPPPSV